MESILVTGGAGFIGSHICKVLAEQGFQPIAYDNLALGHRFAVKWGPLIVGDIKNQNLIKQTCKKYNPIGMMHLAALSNVRQSQLMSLEYYQNNVASCFSLLKAICDCQVPYLIFSSSCSVYGSPQILPLDENHPLCPMHPYGKSKWIIENVFTSLFESGKAHVGCLRYFNVAGADPGREIGELHEPETHVIPSLINAALQQAPAFTLYGEDHNTPDGTPIRDFIHVTDVAHAHVKLLRKLMGGTKHLILNLGTGHGYSIQEIIHALKMQFNRPIPIVVKKKNSSDPPILIANPDQAKQTLNWTPKLSTLPLMLETAWNWLSR